MELTKADVGKEFITRGGQVATVQSMRSGEGNSEDCLYSFVVFLHEAEMGVSVTEKGRYTVTSEDSWDLVSPVPDEPSKAELQESVAETSRRIKAEIERGTKPAPAALVTVEASLQDIARLEREYTITKISYNA